MSDPLTQALATEIPTKGLSVTTAVEAAKETVGVVVKGMAQKRYVLRIDHALNQSRALREASELERHAC